MNGAIPYLISYFAVGAFLGSTLVLHHEVDKGKVAQAFALTILLWPVLILVAPESLFRSPQSKQNDFPPRDTFTKELDELAESAKPALLSDESHRLEKLAKQGIEEVCFFENHSKFEDILKAFWTSGIPPEAYYSFRNAILHLDENYDPSRRVLFSRAAPDWYIGFSTEFVKSIAGLDRKKQGRILEALGRISSAPMDVQGDTIKPLTGDMSGLWRCRLGDDRLVYYPSVKTKKVILISFASRGDVYESKVNVALLASKID